MHNGNREDTLRYRDLSDGLKERIARDRENGWVNPFRFDDDAAVRRSDMPKDRANLWRPVFVRDTEKILHLPVYNRYADKTQVFSFYHNDDITRRALHVQLVSRISRNIGAVLGLNLELIEAISLGHDLGHTPFGHAGERYLSQLYQDSCGRYFNHNVHSVRVLDKLFCRNMTLQTLDGILCHNGEFEQEEYRPRTGLDFTGFDADVEDCYLRGGKAIARLVPSTLEGCVVRICDMIAYLGKDRQDAVKAKLVPSEDVFTPGVIGRTNADMINNLEVDIIENSYGRDHIRLSPAAFEELRRAKKENYEKIYRAQQINEEYENTIRPMMGMLFDRLLADVRSGRENTEIFTEHIRYVEENRKHYGVLGEYKDETPEDIVVDYIASMTDDYFIALFRRLFQDSPYKIRYRSYFEERSI